MTEERSTSRENVIERIPCSRSMDHSNITIGTCAVVLAIMTASRATSIVVRRMIPCRLAKMVSNSKPKLG